MKTLVQVGEHIGISHAQLSKIERGKGDYNQTLLELLAELYRCDVVDLLIRNPLDPEALWSVWDQARPGERAQITDVAKIIIRSRAA